MVYLVLVALLCILDYNSWECVHSHSLLPYAAVVYFIKRLVLSP